MNNDFINQDILDIIIERDGYLEQVKENEKEIERPNKDLDTAIGICNNRQKEIVRLNNIINELKQKLNLAENILYDYLYKDKKITKELYDEFKELKGDSRNE